MSLSLRIPVIADERPAVVGVGTLIVFIALILVSAIAAAVVIQTASLFAEQAEQQGEAARQEVGGGIKVLTVVGDRADGAAIAPCNLGPFGGAAPIRCIVLTVTLWDPSESLDISNLRVQWQSDNFFTTLTIGAGVPPAATATTFGAEETPVDVLGPGQDSWDSAAGSFFLDDDNVVQIWIDLTPATGINDPLAQNTGVTITLLPDKGPPSTEEFVTPSTYTGQFIDLTNA